MLKALREKRGKLIHDAREILEKSKAEKREMTAEESSAWSAIIDQVQKVTDDMVKHERQAELERDTLDAAGAAAEQRGQSAKTAEQRVAETLDLYFKRGVLGGEGLEEFRAMQVDNDTSGGFLVMPKEFVGKLIQAVDNAVHIRNKATKFTVTKAVSLGVPTFDTDLDDADWTVELSTGNEDTALAFGGRELNPHPMAKLIKISNKLMSMSAIPIESLIRARMAYKFGVTQEKGFMTGNGSRQALGVFTASDNGISTGRDVSTGNTTTEIKFDNLINVKYALKSAYHGKAEWIFHRDALKQLAKLKDGEGNYIWRQSVREGEPDKLLGLPYVSSEYAPNTFTTGLYVGILGDFSHYWIVDAMSLQVQRLNELYAATNQTGFIGRAEVDGQPVLEEAFVRVKLA